MDRHGRRNCGNAYSRKSLANFPQIAAQHMYVGRASGMQMVRDPASVSDVIVTNNMFGDIINRTSAAGFAGGGLGMAGQPGNIHPARTSMVPNR